MPSAAGSLCEACHGISLINVLVSVTTQHTHLAPTCPDAQPQEELQGVKGLDSCSWACSHAQQGGPVCTHPTTLYPSYLNDNFFITCPNLRHTKGSGVPTNGPHLGQLSEPAFWRGNLIGSGNLASYRPAHNTSRFWAYLSNFHLLCSQGLRVSACWSPLWLGQSPGWSHKGLC